MRYFVRLAYRGTAYCGWQRQPDAPSVQQTLEEALSTVLREKTEVVGCGRTDAGVHASDYYLHFDTDAALDAPFVRRLNAFLPSDIALFGVHAVAADAHARYDATRRTYTYRLTFRKDPFHTGLACYFPYPERPDPEAMRAAARLLTRYEAFFPFCRSKSDARHMRCRLDEAVWTQPSPHELTFTISANRFLRGMVRLIVGMCLNVGLGKTDLEEVRRALDRQERLPRPESAPPEGLYLSGVDYPYAVP